MKKEELQEMKMQIINTAETLYQNKAEGLQEIAKTLPLMHQIGDRCITLDTEKQLQVIHTIRALIEGYQASDVLLLADTLYYKGTELVDFCLARGDRNIDL